MDSIFGVSWQLFAASLLMGFGALLAALGLRREMNGIRRPVRDPAKVLTLVRGFRVAIIGLACVGIGAAWLWDQTWLLVLSLAIGGEETLKSSTIIFALTRGRDLRLGPASRRG